MSELSGQALTVKFEDIKQNLTCDATFIMNIGDPGTSPCTCLNRALTSSSL